MHFMIHFEYNTPLFPLPIAGQHVQMWRNPQNQKYIIYHNINTINSPSEMDQAMTTVNLYQKFG